MLPLLLLPFIYSYYFYYWNMLIETKVEYFRFSQAGRKLLDGTCNAVASKSHCCLGYTRLPSEDNNVISQYVSSREPDDDDISTQHIISSGNQGSSMS
jgi:hypothetical protein